MSDLERRLEELFTSDSRARRVDQVNVGKRARAPLMAAGFVGAVLVVTAAAIFSLTTMRPSNDGAAAKPSGSPATSVAAGGVPSPSASTSPGFSSGVLCGDVSQYVGATSSAAGGFEIATPATGGRSRVTIPVGMRVDDPTGWACVRVRVPTMGGPGGLELVAVLAPGTDGYIARPTPTASPGSTAPTRVRPDASHGVITVTALRSESDPAPLGPERSNESNAWAVAVSPDGRRVAMLLGGEGAQRLVTFTTSRPNDVTTVLDLSGSGETATRAVWAGDGSNSLLINASKYFRGPGGGDNLGVEYSALRSVELSTSAVKELTRVSGKNITLFPLAWLPARQLAAGLEMLPLGPLGRYVIVRGTNAEFVVLPGGTGGAWPTASRDGTRVVGPSGANVRWWPVDQPSAAREIAGGTGSDIRAVEFRPNSDEIGLNVQGPCTSCQGGLGVPPPTHFEIWTLGGARRTVGPDAFGHWRVDGTAAISATNPLLLIDPDTGGTTPLPGDPKLSVVVATVLF